MQKKIRVDLQENRFYFFVNFLFDDKEQKCLLGLNFNNIFLN